MRQSPQFEKLKDYVQMTVTGEGLRIELIETEKALFFATGEPFPTETGRSLLVNLSKELGQMKNSILVEGIPIKGVSGRAIFKLGAIG